MSASAFGADPQSLSTNVPVPTQDALAVQAGALELQGTSVYTRDNYNSAGRDLIQLTPTVKFGPVKHLQLDLSVPYAAGTQSSANQGNGSADFLYQFNDPSPIFPALAVQAGYQFFEYGAGHRSNQYFLRGLMTQWLGDNDKAPRLHLNVNWTQVTTPSKTGRKDQLELGVAYSMLVSDRVAFVTDVVHGSKATKDQNQTVIDVGLRWLASDRFALSAAVGGGFGQQSPAFRAIFAIQYDFTLF